MNDDHSLRMGECYNLFTQKRDTVLTWNEVLKETARIFGRTKDEVFETMNQLIDSGKIEVPIQDHYCLPGVYAKKHEQEARESARAKINMNSKTLTRNEYDLLGPKEQSDFCRNGGRIV